MTLAFCLVGLLRSASSQVATADSDRSADRLLLLTNGNVVRGRPKNGFDGYVVEKPTGTLLLAADQVRLEAKDVQEAYRKQRDTMRFPSAKDHFDLAGWCLTYELYEESRHELREALKLKPSFEVARKMLQRLEQALAPEFSASEPQTKTDLSGERPLAPAQRSLGGLTPETAQEFVKRVQPIVINKCGNASCHGSAAKNDFQLAYVRSGHSNRRSLVIRNLQSVLRYVNSDQPDRSPLIVAPRDQHEFVRRAVFYGNAGKHQSAILQNWVRQIALETTAQQEPQPAAASHQDAEATSDSPAAELIAEQNRSAPTSPPSDVPATAEDRFIQEILREKRPDAFDPELFNRGSRK